MNPYLSHKLRIISFLSVILVVFLHSYNVGTGFLPGSPLSDSYSVTIQNFFYQGLTRIAVPLLFAISGYLFFRNINATGNSFVLKFRKRLKTLLVPYLLWSGWGVVFYFLLQLIPQTRPFFKQELVIQYSVLKLFHTLFISPVPYQLWFLRDLMLLVFLSPLLYFITRHLHFIPLLIFFIIWFTFPVFNYIIFKPESLFFYSAGAYFATHRPEILLKVYSSVSTLLFPFLWVLILLFKMNPVFTLSPYIPISLYLHKAGILTGIVSVWILYDRTMLYKNEPHPLLQKISLFSFFIYAFHEPVLSIIKKSIFFLLGSTAQTAILNYFLAPFLTLLLAFLTAQLLRRYTKKFYDVITGGR